MSILCCWSEPRSRRVPKKLRVAARCESTDTGERAGRDESIEDEERAG
jgi:hypothetical protein